jgi:hypothetical protein
MEKIAKEYGMWLKFSGGSRNFEKGGPLQKGGGGGVDGKFRTKGVGGGLQIRHWNYREDGEGVFFIKTELSFAHLKN